MLQKLQYMMKGPFTAYVVHTFVPHDNDIMVAATTDNILVRRFDFSDILTEFHGFAMTTLRHKDYRNNMFESEMKEICVSEIVVIVVPFRPKQQE